MLVYLVRNPNTQNKADKKIHFFTIYFLYNILIAVGKTTSKSGIATRKPPIIAIANGRWSWAPVPTPIASGIREIIAPIAVINLGRRRVEMAYTIESSTFRPRRASRY